MPPAYTGGSNPKPPPIIPPKPKNPSGSSSAVVPNIVPAAPPTQIVVPDGGQLVCTIKENICTGEILSVSKSSNCAPTSASDVPGPIQLLCYSDGLPTYYSKTKQILIEKQISCIFDETFLTKKIIEKK